MADRFELAVRKALLAGMRADEIGRRVYDTQRKAGASPSEAAMASAEAKGITKRYHKHRSGWLYDTHGSIYSSPDAMFLAERSGKRWALWKLKDGGEPLKLTHYRLVSDRFAALAHAIDHATGA